MILYIFQFVAAIMYNIIRNSTKLILCKRSGNSFLQISFGDEGMHFFLILFRTNICVILYSEVVQVICDTLFFQQISSYTFNT